MKNLQLDRAAVNTYGGESQTRYYWPRWTPAEGEAPTEPGETSGADDEHVNQDALNPEKIA
jgi:hypothetical protein